MFSRILFLMSFLAAFTPWTNAQNATPTAPGLTYLYTLNCTLAPAINIGYGPRGNRVAIPITGGYFNGPKLSGKLMQFGVHHMHGLQAPPANSEHRASSMKDANQPSLPT